MTRHCRGHSKGQSIELLLLSKDINFSPWQSPGPEADAGHTDSRPCSSVSPAVKLVSACPCSHPICTFSSHGQQKQLYCSTNKSREISLG